MKNAIEVGYSMFDTATFYDNFIPIGESFQNLKRDDFYLISKVWHDAQTPSKLQHDLQQTLHSLKMDYLDAYLLHWPNSEIAIDDTVNEMYQLKKQGLIRHIGISNIVVNHLRRLSDLKISLDWVQVEMNPYFCDFELLEFCQAKGIGIQAWAPLGRGKISQDKLLAKIGAACSKTASQVALKWIIQHECLPFPGSSNLTHIQENFIIDDFALTNDDMAAIDERASTGKRERVTKEMGLGFTDEFDFTKEECWPSA